MILFPNAKINIGLQVLSKRADGYHDISTFFYPAPIYDILEIVPSQDKNSSLTNSGIPCNVDDNDNLCCKALKILTVKYSLPPVKIYLHKTIPIGAGLAGGSSDAAFTLKALNLLFRLNISDEELEMYAASIGSDCAFFIKNKPAIASSKGEILNEFSISIEKMIIIVKPDIFVSTPKAYSMTTPNNNVPELNNLLLKDISTWKDYIVNDFEKPIFNIHPKIQMIKEKLYESGAIYASMSGSGSSVYGFFDKIPDIHNYFADCQVFTGRLT